MEQRTKLILHVIAAVFVIALVVELIVLVFAPSTTLTFRVDTGRRIDGEVYLDDTYLGSTIEGSVAARKIKPGNLHFFGQHKRRHFNASFPLTEAKLKNKNIDFLISEEDVTGYYLHFYVDETAEPIDGVVYLNENPIGSTKGGSLVVNHSELVPGELRISGTYDSKPFDFDFDFPTGYLVHHARDFPITQGQIDNLFDAALLNTKEIEQHIIRLVNEQRSVANLSPLREDDKANRAAQQHSKELIYPTKDFTIGERLDAVSAVYLTAAENLFLTEDLDSSATEEGIAVLAVEAWMDSPAHRSVLLADVSDYTHVGAGVTCEKQSCFLDLITVGKILRSNEAIGGNACHFVFLYDPIYPLGKSVNIRVRLTAADPLGAYIIADPREFERCLEGGTINSLATYLETEQLTHEIAVQPGYGLLLATKDPTSVALEIEYD